MPFLRIFTGDRITQHEIPPSAKIFSIGRSENCSVTLTDRTISKIHCCLRQENGQWIINDGNGRPSSNGVWLNGKKLGEKGAALNSGDTILFPGGTSIVFATAEITESVIDTLSSKPHEEEEESPTSFSEVGNKWEFFAIVLRLWSDRPWKYSLLFAAGLLLLSFKDLLNFVLLLFD